jgi:hypothetical protein
MDAVVPALLVMLLISSCSLFGQPQPAGNATANATFKNATPEPTNPSNETNKAELAWAYINKANVEKNCLVQAKEYASSKGFGPGAVYTCFCIGNETQGEKHYSCTISALDGNHAVDIGCVKADSTCVFSISGQNKELTIEEVYSIANG